MFLLSDMHRELGTLTEEEQPGSPTTGEFEALSSCFVFYVQCLCVFFFDMPDRVSCLVPASVMQVQLPHGDK